MSEAAQRPTQVSIPDCMKAYQFPENQFNRLIEEVSQRYVNAFFANKSHITGDDILRFCEQIGRAHV